MHHTSPTCAPLRLPTGSPNAKCHMRSCPSASPVHISWSPTRVQHNCDPTGALANMASSSTLLDEDDDDDDDDDDEEEAEDDDNRAPSLSGVSKRLSSSLLSLSSLPLPLSSPAARAFASASAKSTAVLGLSLLLIHAAPRPPTPPNPRRSTVTTVLQTTSASPWMRRNVTKSTPPMTASYSLRALCAFRRRSLPFSSKQKHTLRVPTSVLSQSRPLLQSGK